MTPNLYSLYKRGNYFHLRLGKDAEPETKKEEKERFAMAAIGFVLMHHDGFYNHFLKQICGIQPIAHKKDITVEQKLWGDMVLRTPDGIFVIEAKINATLKPHQNPENEVEFWQNTKGYGAEIMRRFSNDNPHYVILGYRNALNLPKRSMIHCSHKFWDKLEEGYPETKNDLACDLADCLALLGVEAFNLRKTKKMKITESLYQATSAFEILDSVALRCGLDRAKLKYSYSSAEGWGLGYDVYKTEKASAKEHIRLNDLNRHKDYILWFGYCGTSNENCSRYVSVSLRDLKHVHMVEAVLKKALGDNDSSFTVVPNEVDKWLEISADLNTSDDPKAGVLDYAWFMSIFDILKKSI